MDFPMKKSTRQAFLKSTLIGSGTIALSSYSRLYGAVGAASGSANGDIRIAVAGINGQGSSHMRHFPKIPGVRLVALCDPDREVLAKRVEEMEKTGSKIKSFRDYRKLLENKEIDAVIIAAPNHWHSLMTIWALQAGKDVYVEKPLSHNI